MYERQYRDDIHALNVEVALSAESLQVKQGGMSVNYVWADITEIVDTRDSIEFWPRQISACVVQKAPFSTDAATVDFLEVARNYHSAALSQKAQTC